MKYANVLKYAGISLFLAVLVAGHVIGLRHLLSHLAWPIAVGMIVLVLLNTSEFSGRFTALSSGVPEVLVARRHDAEIRLFPLIHYGAIIRPATSL